MATRKRSSPLRCHSRSGHCERPGVGLKPNSPSVAASRNPVSPTLSSRAGTRSRCGRCTVLPRPSTWGCLCNSCRSANWCAAKRFSIPKPSRLPASSRTGGPPMSPLTKGALPIENESIGATEQDYRIPTQPEGETEWNYGQDNPEPFPSFHTSPLTKNSPTFPPFDRDSTLRQARGPQVHQPGSRHRKLRDHPIPKFVEPVETNPAVTSAFAPPRSRCGRAPVSPLLSTRTCWCGPCRSADGCAAKRFSIPKPSAFPASSRIGPPSPAVLSTWRRSRRLPEKIFVIVSRGAATARTGAPRWRPECSA